MDSERINALSEEAELFYRRLMSVVDDHGRFEDKIELIRARCFPLRLEAWPSDRVAKCLTEVSKPPSNDGHVSDKRPSNDGQMTDICLPLVSRYTVDGRNYLQVNNFGQRTRASRYPPPPHDRHVSDKRPSNDGHVTDKCPPTHARVSKADGVGEGEGVVEGGGVGDARAAAPSRGANGHRPPAGPSERLAGEITRVQAMYGPTDCTVPFLARRLLRRPDVGGDEAKALRLLQAMPAGMPPPGSRKLFQFFLSDFQPGEERKSEPGLTTAAEKAEELCRRLGIE